ncbi:hypothetical protein FRC04_007012 [Tulasnella sp. 424]|nr:hypothetical protein FRC04_007012 [Tulasnella sp. 424]KAG8973053.1 hypothetical protein FRC05_009168 [Tulasnella sp. 425]
MNPTTSQQKQLNAMAMAEGIPGFPIGRVPGPTGVPGLCVGGQMGMRPGGPNAAGMPGNAMGGLGMVNNMGANMGGAMGGMNVGGALGAGASGMHINIPPGQRQPPGVANFGGNPMAMGGQNWPNSANPGMQQRVVSGQNIFGGPSGTPAGVFNPTNIGINTGAAAGAASGISSQGMMGSAANQASQLPGGNVAAMGVHPNHQTMQLMGQQQHPQQQQQQQGPQGSNMQQAHQISGQPRPPSGNTGAPRPPNNPSLGRPPSTGAQQYPNQTGRTQAGIVSGMGGMGVMPGVLGGAPGSSPAQHGQPGSNGPGGPGTHSMGIQQMTSQQNTWSQHTPMIGQARPPPRPQHGGPPGQQPQQQGPPFSPGAGCVPTPQMNHQLQQQQQRMMQQQSRRQLGQQFGNQDMSGVSPNLTGGGPQSPAQGHPANLIATLSQQAVRVESYASNISYHGSGNLNPAGLGNQPLQQPGVPSFQQQPPQNPGNRLSQSGPHPSPSPMGRQGGPPQPPPTRSMIQAESMGAGNPVTAGAGTGPGLDVSTPDPLDVVGSPGDAPGANRQMMMMMTTAQYKMASLTHIGLGQGVIRMLEFSSAMANGHGQPYQYWGALVDDFFVPNKGCMRMTLTKDGAEVKPFEIFTPTLPRFFFSSFCSGVTSIHLTLNAVRESCPAPGESIVDCTNASFTYTFDSGYVVVLSGPLRAHIYIVPNQASQSTDRPSHQPHPEQGQPGPGHSLKFNYIEFTSKKVSKTIDPNAIKGPRMLLPFPASSGVWIEAESPMSVMNGMMGGDTPVNSLVNGHESTGSGESSSPTLVSGSRTASSANTLMGGPGERGWVMERVFLPAEPVNAFGIPESTMRILELAESVAQLSDLITLSFDHGFGPIQSLAHYANRVRQTIPEELHARSDHIAQATMQATETELLDLIPTQFNNGQLPSGNMIPLQPPRPAQGTVLMNSNSAKDNTTSNMNPATKPTVEFAVDILLQSIQDENKTALETMRPLLHNQGDPKNDTAMLGHVDSYAGAIKATLDDVQRHLLDKMSALHKEHNRMIPLHRLPIEMFVQIITGALEPFQTYHWAQTHLRQLLTLCRVCKRWRDVIDGTPSLWATIDVRDPPALTSVALSRSSNHSLNIIGVSSSSPPKYWNLPVGWKRFDKVAIMHSRRWRFVQLLVASSADAQALINAPAPRLQSLEVKSTVQCRVNFQKEGSILQETGNRLRRLALHGLAIPWRGCMLHDLRYLSISGLDEFAPSFDEILGVLRMCQALVEVDLALRPTATVGTSKRERPFTLSQLRSMSFGPLIPSWTLVLLETIHIPSVRHVALNLDVSGAGSLLSSTIKRARALLSTVIDAPYQLTISACQNRLGWTYYPRGIDCAEWSFDVTARNGSANEILEAILLKTDADRFAPESIEIELDGFLHSEFTAALRKLDGVDHILEFSALGCDLDPLFTYMSSATTGHGWGLPELEKLIIYDCDYDPAQLLNMVLSRYGEEGDGISDRGGRPPPFKRVAISHAPGEADEDTLGLVEDIVGDDCFVLEEDVER